MPQTQVLHVDIHGNRLWKADTMDTVNNPTDWLEVSGCNDSNNWALPHPPDALEGVSYTFKKDKGADKLVFEEVIHPEPSAPPKPTIEEQLEDIKLNQEIEMMALADLYEKVGGVE